MRRAASSLGVRTALITGLFVLMFGPATAAAADCSGQLDVYSGPNQPPVPSLARGSEFLLLFSGGPGGWEYSVTLEGGGLEVFLVNLDSKTKDDGDVADSLPVPAHFPVGGGQVHFVVKGCDYYHPVTITQTLSLDPAVSLTTAPVLNPNPAVTLPTTTTTTTTATTTTTLPAAPASSSSTAASSTSTSEPTTIAAQVSATAPSSSASQPVTSTSSATSTTLVAAATESENQGLPWAVWVFGGLTVLLLGVAAIRKGFGTG